MPFSSEPAPAVHTGNGSSDTLTIPWVYHNKSDVVVKRRTAADTALTTLALTTDYTLTDAGDENGGTLTFVSVPASDVKTYAWLDPPNKQETRHKDGDARRASTMNVDLDRIIQRIAVLEEAVKRSWRLPLPDTGSDMEGVVEKATLLGKVAVFDAASGKLTGQDAEDALNGATVLTTRGDLIRRGATAAERVALGAANSFLASDGSDAVWKTAAQARTAMDATRTLSADLANAATIADTNETDLHTYTLPGGTLATNGAKVRVSAWGYTANNANTKRLRLYFGATTVIDTTAVALVNGSWTLEMEVSRSGAAAQRGFGRRASSDSTVISAAANRVTPAETLSGDVVIKVTGLNGTANANDIICEGMTVEYVTPP